MFCYRRLVTANKHYEGFSSAKCTELLTLPEISHAERCLEELFLSCRCTQIVAYPTTRTWTAAKPRNASNFKTKRLATRLTPRAATTRTWTFFITMCLCLLGKRIGTHTTTRPKADEAARAGHDYSVAHLTYTLAPDYPGRSARPALVGNWPLCNIKSSSYEAATGVILFIEIAANDGFSVGLLRWKSKQTHLRFRVAN